MPERDLVFVSYSRNDWEAARNLRGQLEQAGLAVFHDDEAIREGDLWLDRLQRAVDACGGFVVLVGRDGVARWVGAETQAALNRYFSPRDDADRLPICPVLIDGATPESLPAFLRLFQATTWNGADSLPVRLLEQVRARAIVADDRATFEGCPFVGLASYRIDQAHLFFGRQKETLDALACFGTRPGRAAVRWLEISGNSGSGKSSLMNAGLLPLVEKGWLWPRTGIAQWRRIGPMLPGAHPVAMLAEQLARTFTAEMAEVRRILEVDDRAFADWLRGRKQDDIAFLLAIDQFEELFTFADPAERGRFDRLLATALADVDCPLFVISTVRADFLDRLDELPRLVAVRNRSARPWTLPPIAADGLREVIAGPARLAGLDVSAIQEAMVAEAQDEPGALPLVENALFWLWEKRSGNRLSGELLTARGGLAGIVSESADGLLASLGPQRERALDLLFRLVNVDPEGRRHTRRRMPYVEAVATAGRGEAGRALLGRLAGERQVDGGQAHGPLRLITVTNEADGTARPGGDDRQVSLIHETLIRSKAPGAQGRQQPFWPTLWTYIEQHKHRAARRERLRLLAGEWGERQGIARLVGLAGWRGVIELRGLATPGSREQRFLRWSNISAAVRAVLLVAAIGLVGESVYWKMVYKMPLEALWTRWTHLLGKELPFPTLITVPAGSSNMGNESGEEYEQPRHPVTLAQPFAMGATEVTIAEYNAFARATGRTRLVGAEQIWGGGSALGVNWFDARDYARWLGAMIGERCRLPSETEWEYTCRIRTNSANDRPDGILVQGTNNSYEWMEDCLHKNYQEAPSDGRPWLSENRGDCTSRMLRSSYWSHSKYFDVCSRRGMNYDPYARNIPFGLFITFRVVCSSPSSGSEP